MVAAAAADKGNDSGKDVLVRSDWAREEADALYDLPFADLGSVPN